VAGGYSSEAQAAVEAAGRLAAGGQVHAAHLLLAVIASGDPVVERLTGADPARLARAQKLLTDSAPLLPPRQIPGVFAKSGFASMSRAVAYARTQSSTVSLVHLLAASAVDPEPVVALLLGVFDLDARQLMERIARLAAADTAGDPLPEPVAAAPGRRRGARQQADPVDSFVTDLVFRAREGQLPQVVGRDQEVERVLQVLCRRSKSNPVLIGEAGVGKTAIVEGIAQRIASGRVPEQLRDAKIWSIDVGAMMGGTRLRGEFEERTKKLLAKAAQVGGVILFIDEIHQIVDAGASSAGGMSLVDQFKPELSRGRLKLIGATTTDEYRQVARDKALERRLQPVTVEEPDRDATIAIARAVASDLAKHHGVLFTRDAITQAVDLADRFLPYRRSPDKVIDVLDESAAARAMARLALDADSRAKAAETVALLRRRQAALDADDLATVAQMQSDLDAQADLVQLLQVDAAAVAQTVSTLAGVEVSAAEGEETVLLLELEERLARRVVGQGEAVSALARAVRRRRAGLGDEARPASFIFAGPSGVGKTECARALADLLYGDGALLQIDLSEYMEAHTVARLIGAPPGYVGFDEPGQLTEPVRRNPYQVVLLDELDKAHPKVLDILLQLLEEGQLTDSTGRKVSFAHTLVVATTNAGADSYAAAALGFASLAGAADDVSGRVRDALGRMLRPELVNRFDQTVVFSPLGVQELRSITVLLLDEMLLRATQAGLTVSYDDAVVSLLAAAATDPSYGARPLRRAVQAQVEDALAELVLSGVSGAVHLTVTDGAVVAEVAARSPETV
jgi:ATP-dependent Clp protease ATP-binding subunit ClpC